MDDRGLARLLLRRLRESGQEAETTVSVAELHRMLIPYPACRDALGFATKAEYDLALLHLLREAGVVRVGEEELAEAVEDELRSPEPGLAFLKNFAASPLEIRGREGLEGSVEPEPSADGDDPDSGPAGSADVAETEPGEPAPSAGEWLASLERAVGDDVRVAQPSGPRCGACEGELPSREGVRYCPHCGADQTGRRCGACGEPLDPEWKYCPRCGETGDGADG